MASAGTNAGAAVTRFLHTLFRVTRTGQRTQLLTLQALNAPLSDLRDELRPASDYCDRATRNWANAAPQRESRVERVERVMNMLILQRAIPILLCLVMLALESTGAAAQPSAAAPAESRPATPFQVTEATIDGIHAAMRAGRLTCTQLVQAYLDRIMAYDQNGPRLNAVQSINPNASALAAKLDAVYRTSGPVGPLHCIPVLVKDEVETSFLPTTYGSAIFKHFTPPQNATIVDR